MQVKQPQSMKTVDEKKYYLSHLFSYGVNYSDVMRVAEELEKNSKTKLQDYQYIVQAILNLNKNLKKADLDQYKDSYDEFAWFVSFAPVEKLEIAVISVIVQGAAPPGPARRPRPMVRSAAHICELLNAQELSREQVTEEKQAGCG